MNQDENVVQRKKTVYLILFFVFFLSPVTSFAYTWDAKEGFNGWSTFNINNVQWTGDGMIIHRKYRNLDMVIAARGGIITKDESIVKIRLRTMGTGSVISCMLTSGKRTITTKEQIILSGKSWKDYMFDLSPAIVKLTPVDRIAFRIGSSDNIEIHDIQIQEPSFSDIIVAKYLYLHNVNFLYPLKLYGFSLNLWFYSIIIMMVLSLTIYYFITKNRKIVIIMGIVLISLYILYDLRENYDEMNIITTTYKDFITAAPGEKRFHFWGNLIEFGEFIQSNLPSGEDTVQFFGNNNRYVYIKYLLYPVKVVKGNDIISKVNVFHYADNVRFERDKIIMNNRVVLEGGRLIPYNPQSFIYITQ